MPFEHISRLGAGCYHGGAEVADRALLHEQGAGEQSVEGCTAPIPPLRNGDTSDNTASLTPVDIHPELHPIREGPGIHGRYRQERSTGSSYRTILSKTSSGSALT